MNILNKFENLTKQAIFSSNKNKILQSVGLLDTIKDKNNQKIRMSLSNGSEQFPDMSRVVK